MYKVFICAGVKERDMVKPLQESLGNDISINIFDGSDVESFAKMINIIFYCGSKTNDIIIFCSHRVRPTYEDVGRMVKLISEGYGLVMFKRLAFFGCKKELFSKVGFFDERFIPGGYEDDDFFLRIQEANISMYEDASVKYIPGKSTWNVELKKYPGVEFKQPITYEYFIKKWRYDHNKRTITRLLPESSITYDITDTNDTYFKPWDESVFLDNENRNTYKINVDMEIKNKKILLFGGSGSLGNKLIDIMGQDNEITVFSRDENKHWHMSQKYKETSLKYIIGDIRDHSRVQQIIQKLDPHIIIIASAMKHIDKCEFDVNETLLTNTIGVLNVCKAVQSTFNVSKRLENVIFISTDKACSPTNVYGMSKSLSERVVIEYSLNMKNTKVKFTNCRYGNVLDSRGSIIPKLKNSISDTYYLHNPEMTRFVMTQEQAVELIKFSILKGQTGQTIIPKLKSMKIKDLFEIFSEKYNKKIEISTIRPGEKIHEELLNIEELYRTTSSNSYYIIHPSYNTIKSKLQTSSSYSSDTDIMTKEFLTNYLTELNLL